MWACPSKVLDTHMNCQLRMILYYVFPLATFKMPGYKKFEPLTYKVLQLMLTHSWNPVVMDQVTHMNDEI